MDGGHQERDRWGAPAREVGSRRALTRGLPPPLPGPAHVPPRHTFLRRLDSAGLRAGVLGLQAHAGNAAVQRLVAGVVQRDELPPVPNYQLQPPTLRVPGWQRPGLLGDEQLRLDPDVAAQMQALQRVQELLDPNVLRPSLLQLDPSVAGLGAAPDPFSAPAVPQPGPLVPRGEGPGTPRAATAGDLLRAILAVPAIDGALTSLRTQAQDRVGSDWQRLRTGEQGIVVSALALVGVGALAGVASDPAARRLALDQLDGRTFPVPTLPALRFELNTQRDGVMVGAHLDVGRLLPSSFGFGPSSPRPIGGPPQPEPSPFPR